MPDATAPKTEAATGLAAPQWWPLAATGIALLALIGSAIMVLRRRKPQARHIAERPIAAVGASNETRADLPRVDLQLDIVSATRSVMMFTLEYRLTLCNRSDHAMRDISLSAEILCARRGAASTAAFPPGQPVAKIDWIGPQQSRSITAQVQLPLNSIQPIRQGKTPLLIPLLHVTIDGANRSTLTRSFVIGSPSAASQSRLHPIPLDTPPGGVPGLRAQLVSAPDTAAAA